MHMHFLDKIDLLVKDVFNLISDGIAGIHSNTAIHEDGDVDDQITSKAMGFYRIDAKNTGHLERQVADLFGENFARQGIHQVIG